MNSEFCKRNFEFTPFLRNSIDLEKQDFSNRKMLKNTKSVLKNFLSKPSCSTKAPIKKKTIVYSGNHLGELSAPSWSAGFPEGNEEFRKFANKKQPSLQFLLKNLKYFHFQQKNQVQSSVLTYPIKDFLKIAYTPKGVRVVGENPSTSFKPFFALEKVDFKNTHLSYYSPYFLASSGYRPVGDQLKTSKNKWFEWVNKENKLKSSVSELTKIFTVQENLGSSPTGKVLMDSEKKQGTKEPVPLMKYSKLHELKLVTISIASPEKMKEWAEKTLPNGKIFGEVTNANTLHYKTFKPHKGGLFCERIFGPLKDFECACGIYSKPNELESRNLLIPKNSLLIDSLKNNSLEHDSFNRIFCPNCDVEYTWSVIRRYQLGYIQLVSPVSHIWYLKANPSYLSLLLDFKKSFLESIIYCTQSITLENLLKQSEMKLFDTSPQNLYSIWQKLIEEEKVSQTKTLGTELTLRRLAYATRRSLRADSLRGGKGTVEQQLLKYLEAESKDHTNQMLKNQQKNLSKLEKRFQIFYLLKQFSSLLTNKKNLKQPSFSQSLPLEQPLSLLKNFRTLVNKNRQPFLSKNLLKKNFSYEKFFLKNPFSYSFYAINNVFILYSKTKNGNSNLLKNNQNLINTKLRNLLKGAPEKTLNLINNKIFIDSKNCSIKKKLKVQKNGLTSFQASKASRFCKTSSLELVFRNQILKPYFKFFYFKKIYSVNYLKNYLIDYKLLKDFVSSIDGVRQSPTEKTVDTNWQVPIGKGSFSQPFTTSFYSFFLNSFMNPVFSAGYGPMEKLRVSRDQASWFSKTSSLELVFRNQIQKYFYYAAGFKLTKKIRKVSKILKPLTFSLKKETIYKDFYNLVLKTKNSKFFSIHFLFKEIFKLSIETNLTKTNFGKTTNQASFTSRFFKTSSKELVFRNQTFLLEFQTLLESMYFPNICISCHSSSGNVIAFENSRSFTHTNPLPVKYARAAHRNRLSVLDANTEWNLIERKKALFVVSSKEIQFKKFSRNQSLNRNPEKTFLKESFERKTLPKSFFVKKCLLSKEGFVDIKKASKSLGKLSASKKLKNPLYTISYFYPWSSIQWKSFMYYNSEPFSLEDKPINSYKNRNFTNEKLKKKSVSGMQETTYLETLTGASLVRKLLTEYDSLELKKMIKQHQILIPIVNRSIRKLKNQISLKKSDLLKIQKLLQKRDHIIRRLKLLSKLSMLGDSGFASPSKGVELGWSSRTQPTNPNSMILTILPVLPPDLRPILKLQNQIAASDLNRLYQRIIYRNERLKKFLKDPSTSQSFEMKYAQRLLQEAVDNLIENGKGGVKPEVNARGQALKSLSEILKGKQGRFRQYLLGKRVDYSGRSVIVVGPKLKLSECGLPLRIAIELFLPFLIKKILHYKLAKTVIGAKNFISKNLKVTWNLLNEIMKNHPILLNRAPTLHRLGIQAFLPKLIHGQAILLHPLVCSAFNADFDGDQMAVHVPITVEARTEAWSFLFSRNHLLSAATGEPILLPSQDMVLGCYYLTSENLSKPFSNLWYSKNQTKFQNFHLPPLSHKEIKRKCFYDWDSVLNAYQKNQISLQSIIWMKWNGKIEFSNESFSPLEIRIHSFGNYQKIQSKVVFNFKPVGLKSSLNQSLMKGNKYVRTTAGRVLINTIIQNCIRF